MAKVISPSDASHATSLNGKPQHTHIPIIATSKLAGQATIGGGSMTCGICGEILAQIET